MGVEIFEEEDSATLQKEVNKFIERIEYRIIAINFETVHKAPGVLSYLCYITYKG